jgi:uncharacterized protein with von Willebrand factor type A (vWA) domain
MSSNPEKTSFVSFDGDGNVIVDKQKLHERLREEDLEEALDDDSVEVNATRIIESIRNDIDASDVTMKEIEAADSQQDNE